MEAWYHIQSSGRFQPPPPDYWYRELSPRRFERDEERRQCSFREPTNHLGLRYSIPSVVAAKFLRFIAVRDRALIPRRFPISKVPISPPILWAVGYPYFTLQAARLHTAATGWTMHELERILKKGGLVEAQPRNMPGGTKEAHDKPCSEWLVSRPIFCPSVSRKSSKRRLVTGYCSRHCSQTDWN
jgi:hypothetical protein